MAEFPQVRRLLADIIKTRQRQKGATLFELAVALTLIVAFAAVLLDRLLYLQEMAEKTRMEQTVIAIKAGLRFKMAAMLIEGRERELGKLLVENPVNWLENPPANYVGERIFPYQDEVLPGNWYYDGTDRALVYVANRCEHFQADRSGKKDIRFRVTPSHALREGGTVEGVTITATRVYRWF